MSVIDQWAVTAVFERPKSLGRHRALAAPHADIRGIDLADALKMPGVDAVLTGADYRADGFGSFRSMAPNKKRDGAPRRGKFLMVKIRSFGNLGAFVSFRGAMPPWSRLARCAAVVSTLRLRCMWRYPAC